MMKKIKLYTLGILVLCAALSCSKALEDELFTKFSYLSINGWYTADVSIEDDNTSKLSLYFSVNGTSANSDEITFELVNDPDTLKGYNFERFKNQVAYYYPELPIESYTYDKTSYTIHKGELKTTAIVTIDLKKLADPYQEYVLPVKIKSSNGLPLGPSKYTKVLANILFKNLYSGTYSGSGQLKEVGTNQTLDIAGSKLYANSTNSCFFYAGNVTRSNTANFKDYAIDMLVDNGIVTLSSKNAALQFQPVKAKMTRKYAIIYDDDRYYTETTSLELEYSYKDLAPEEDRTLSYKGIVSINKKVLKSDYPSVVPEE
jgi:hypothetical protein